MWKPALRLTTLLAAPLLPGLEPAALAAPQPVDATLVPRAVGEATGVRAVALRWGPGTELKQALDAWARKSPGAAWSLVTVVGSLTSCRLRYAGKAEATDVTGPLEIVSMTGTLGQDGSHLHASLTDARGHAVGGHLSGGAIVLTTAEVVLLKLEGLTFGRAHDPCTGYRELTIGPRPVP